MHNLSYSIQGKETKTDGVALQVWHATGSSGLHTAQTFAKAGAERKKIYCIQAYTS